MPPRIAVLLCSVQLPPVGRPVHPLRFLVGIVHPVFAAEFAADALGAKHQPVGVSQVLAVIRQAEPTTPVPAASLSTSSGYVVELSGALVADVAGESATLPAEVRGRRRQVDALSLGLSAQLHER